MPSSIQADPVILLVSHNDDDHLAPMVAALATIGSEAVVVDTAGLPVAVAVAAEHGPQGDRCGLRTAPGSISTAADRDGGAGRDHPTTTPVSGTRGRPRGQPTRPTRRWRA